MSEGDLPNADDVRIVVASGNPHKAAEIRAILGAYGLDRVELVPMTEFDLEAPVEDGETFEANALIKARACANATGLVSIADDSGIEVDALGGAPGVRSARYAGEPSDDAANNAKLLRALEGVGDDERTARFVCAVAVAWPDGQQVLARGTMEGRVIGTPKGSQGFGYDPLFVADAAVDGRTNGELAPAEKDAISHRGKALAELARHPDIRQWLGD
ncbi:MAG: RdgB/HAM1 family non-canonical purine NTP pyrophosphatase [Nitriliruptoraceae bacterium]